MEVPDIDQRPSMLPIAFHDEGKILVWVMPVLGLGEIVMRATSNPHTGRLTFIGMKIEHDEPEA
jgi:hypothetical protein